MRTTFQMKNEVLHHPHYPHHPHHLHPPHHMITINTSTNIDDIEDIMNSINAGDHCIFWYFGPNYLAKASVDVYAPYLYKIYNLNAISHLLDLSAWKSFENGDMKCLIDKNPYSLNIEQLSNNRILPIYTCNIFQKLSQLRQQANDNESSLFKLISNDIIKRSELFEISKKYAQNKKKKHVDCHSNLFGDVFKPKSYPVLSAIKNEKIIECYGVIQYIEFMYIIDDILQNDNDNNNNIILRFILPNDEFKYYIGSNGKYKQQFEHDINQFINMKYKKRDINININIQCFKYPINTKKANKRRRPYLERSKFKQTLSAQKLFQPQIDDNDDDEKKINKYDGKTKIPKGTKDYDPGHMIIRNKMINSIKININKFGGQYIETPLIEIIDKDEKSIYKLEKKETEIWCLRHDLNLSLARYVVMNRKNIKSPLKAANIGKIYDKYPSFMNKCKSREFLQCNFSIIRIQEIQNKLELIFDDMEIIAFTIKQLIDLNFGKFILLINNKKLLDGIFDIFNVSDDETVEKIKELKSIAGRPYVALNKLKAINNNNNNNNNNKLNNAIQELELTLDFLQNYNAEYLQYLWIDISLSYNNYNGIIFKAEFANKANTMRYGPIAFGGRCDHFISNLISSNTEQYPFVGISLQFEAIFNYLKDKNGINKGIPTDILIAELTNNNSDNSDGHGLYVERLKLLNQFREKTNTYLMNAEIMNKIKPNFRDQINYAEQREIKWMVIIGDDELKNNTVNLRRLTLIGDIIITKDGKKGIIEEIILSEKWPKFIVKQICNDNNKKWIINKKQIAKVIQNGIEVELNIKDLSRNELIEFLNKFYRNNNDNPPLWVTLSNPCRSN